LPQSEQAVTPLHSPKSSVMFGTPRRDGRAGGQAIEHAKRVINDAKSGARINTMAGQRAIEAEVRNASTANQMRSDEQAPLKLEQFLPYQLNVVANLVSQALSGVYARRYGIGVPEWRVLVTLGQFEAMTAKAIGAHTHMHKTKVSRAVALMEKRRLLTRRANREDKREAFLSLTAAGQAMYKEVAPHALDFAKRLTEILTPADREAFDRAIALLIARSTELVVEAGHEIEED
jgi:DNA-binding MarR family transcriptional regulator